MVPTGPGWVIRRNLPLVKSLEQRTYIIKVELAESTDLPSNELLDERLALLHRGGVGGVESLTELVDLPGRDRYWCGRNQIGRGLVGEVEQGTLVTHLRIVSAPKHHTCVSPEKVV